MSSTRRRGGGKYSDVSWQRTALISVDRFYFADERTSAGKPMGQGPGAESHADMYLRLAEVNEDLPSYVTFAEGKYKQF